MRAWVIAGAMLLSAGIAHAQTPDLRFGEIVFGAPISAVKAATPGVAWDDVSVSEHSGRVFEMLGTNVTTIGGNAYSAFVKEHYYGDYAIILSREVAVANAAACESEGGALVTLIAAQAGRFVGPEPTRAIVQSAGASFRAQTNPNGTVAIIPQPGAISVSGINQERVTLADGSVFTVGAWDNNDGTVPRRRYTTDRVKGFTLEARRQAGTVALDISARYQRGSEPNCGLWITATREAAPPPRPSLAYDPAKARNFASIGAIHLQMADTPEPPKGGVEIPLVCSVQHSDGRARSCWATGALTPAQEPFVAAAVARACCIVIDLGDVDKDDPLDFNARIPIRIMPGDRRPIDFLGRPRTPLSQIRWTQMPSSEDSQSIRDRAPADVTGAVRMACQIQTDLSVICAVISASSPRAQAVYGPEIVELAAHMRAADTLLDGSPSVGAVFEQEHRFTD